MKDAAGWRSDDGSQRVLLGDARELMRGLPSDSFHSCVTDPPYELGIMGKAWDGSGVAFDPATWREVLRVLRPGAYVLAFGGSRTFHRLMVAVEDAGFEIRDTLLWLHGSGFPKGLDVSKAIDKAAGAERKAWEGWRTGLKPAFEPIILARKPLEGTVVQNVLKWGCGGLNIEASRVPVSDSAGRWPANVLHDGSDEVIAAFPKSTSDRKDSRTCNKVKTADAVAVGQYGRDVYDDNTYSDSGSVSRFFWSPKASRSERPSVAGEDGEKVSHPTVKPLGLMRYLIRLVTVDGGEVLEPFAGSGTTIEAAWIEHCRCTGFETDASHLRLIAKRMADAAADLSLFEKAAKVEPVPKSPLSSRSAGRTLFGDDE